MFETNDYKGFIEDIMQGVDIESSAMIHGISISELYRLMEVGQAEERRISSNPKLKVLKKNEYALRVWKNVNRAIAISKAEMQKSIYREAKEDWRGAMGWLERRDFNNFGKTEERIKLSQVEKSIKQLESGE